MLGTNAGNHTSRTFPNALQPNSRKSASVTLRATMNATHSRPFNNIYHAPQFKTAVAGATHTAAAHSQRAPSFPLHSVIPAQAGIQRAFIHRSKAANRPHGDWVPASAGTTAEQAGIQSRIVTTAAPLHRKSENSHKYTIGITVHPTGFKAAAPGSVALHADNTTHRPDNTVATSGNTPSVAGTTTPGIGNTTCHTDNTVTRANALREMVQSPPKWLHALPDWFHARREWSHAHRHHLHAPPECVHASREKFRSRPHGLKARRERSGERLQCTIERIPATESCPRDTVSFLPPSVSRSQKFKSRFELPASRIQMCAVHYNPSNTHHRPRVGRRDAPWPHLFFTGHPRRVP